MNKNIKENYKQSIRKTIYFQLLVRNIIQMMMRILEIETVMYEQNNNINSMIYNKYAKIISNNLKLKQF